VTPRQLLGLALVWGPLLVFLVVVTVVNLRRKRGRGWVGGVKDGEIVSILPVDERFE
jgi:hypothetical protein